MNISKFLILFGVTLVIIAGLLYMMSFNDKMFMYLDVSFYAIPAFSLLSIGVFFATVLLDRNPEKSIILNIVFLNVMLKILITAAVIAYYYNFKQPDDGIFVVPFIVVYVAFTIFETYFMSEQARSK